ncbi:hypothetical protein Sm713_63840 [Streptomyces sp. TS71-3]|nr:hypothetical protein Sm713_63840 [Streptomyces sp. TS71-3]
MDAALSAALAAWCAWAVHDPGKILLDLTLATAVGGDRMADVMAMRAGPAVFGPVNFDPAVSRPADTAVAGSWALTAIRTHGSQFAAAWQLAELDAPHAPLWVLSCRARLPGRKCS